MKNRLLHIGIIIAVITVLPVFISCKGKPGTKAGQEKVQTYTCPMHPQIISEKPGTCPICGMDLVPFDKTNMADFLTLSEPQQALANVRTDTVRSGSFSTFKQLNGRLVVNPEQTEFVSSRVGGRIENLYVRETGVNVRQGQALYQIYSEQLAALQQEYILAVVQATQFPEDLKFQQLAQAARQRLLLYGQTEAQLQQLKTKKQTSPYITYYSPSGGVVAELFVTEGQYVAEGASIMSLEGYQEIWVEADLYPSESDLVKKGDIVNITISGFENERRKMRIDFIAPALQPASQLLTIRGTIPNTQNQLKAGMQAVVELPVSHTSNSMTLPSDAVIRDGNGSHVWVETGVGKFEPRMVVMGAENFNRVEITSGLKAGESVVISGAYLLYSEFVLKKGKNPMEGHQH